MSLAGGRGADDACSRRTTPGDGPTCFDLDLDLGPVPASTDEVWEELGTRIDGYQPRLAWKDAHLQCSLRIVAGDLWLAVLMGMTALSGAGYPVVGLDVRRLCDALEDVRLDSGAAGAETAG